MNSDQDSPGIRCPPPFIYLGFLLAGIGAEYVVGPRSFGIERVWLVAAGVVLAAAGIALANVAILLFRRAGTSEKPWETSRAIVIAGPYRFTRNPMYVGLTLLHAGLALALDTPVALILLPVVLVIIQTQVIAREERYLVAKFGAPYDEYRRRVRRWL